METAWALTDLPYRGNATIKNLTKTSFLILTIMPLKLQDISEHISVYSQSINQEFLRWPN